jgi:carbon storage regulator
MLILTRKAGEGFWIGDQTEVVIFSCEGSSVKIGVRAPRDIVVLRTELKEVEEQNRAAAEANAPAALDRLAAQLRHPRL